MSDEKTSCCGHEQYEHKWNLAGDRLFCNYGSCDCMVKARLWEPIEFEEVTDKIK